MRVHVQGSNEAAEEIGGLMRGVGEAFGVSNLLLGAAYRKYGMRAAEQTLLLRLAFGKFESYLKVYPTLEASLQDETKKFFLLRYSCVLHAYRARSPRGVRAACIPRTQPARRA